VDPIAFARDLIDIDSTTGREGEAGRFIAGCLHGLGFSVTEQPVDGDRANVIATAGPASKPVVMLSTHFDCVPPFFPSRIEGDRLYGRGACDAKGILAAQVAAAERLRLQGETRVGLLFVVGEERGSDGAKLANEAAAGARFLVNGEPTESRLGAATRGILRVKLHAEGRAAHSSFPELGISAIDKLIDAQSAETDVDKRKKIVWEIEKKLAEDVARPVIGYNVDNTCWDPKVKGLNLQVNSIYNGWRFEDVWLDK